MPEREQRKTGFYLRCEERKDLSEGCSVEGRRGEEEEEGAARQAREEGAGLEGG